MAKTFVLKNPSEFKRVYSFGKRCDTSSLIAIFLPNGLARHRLGVTVSRKYSRSAVKRNRAKRLLRETFRGNEAYLNSLKNTYDWVLLPKRLLANVRLDAPLADFKRIIEIIAAKEAKAFASVSSEASGESL